MYINLKEFNLKEIFKMHIGSTYYFNPAIVYKTLTTCSRRYLALCRSCLFIVEITNSINETVLVIFFNILQLFN